MLFKYVFESTPKIHLDLTVYLSRDREFNRMSDRSDVALHKCGHDARFGAAKDSPMEWSPFLPDRG